MGMQCTFSATDLESTVATKTVHDMESDTYSIEVMHPLVYGGPVFNYFNGNTAEDCFCWFDCGSANEDQMKKIKWLIQNRIPFNCA